MQFFLSIKIEPKSRFSNLTIYMTKLSTSIYESYLFSTKSVIAKYIIEAISTRNAHSKRITHAGYHLLALFLYVHVFDLSRRVMTLAESNPRLEYYVNALIFTQDDLGTPEYRRTT